MYESIRQPIQELRGEIGHNNGSPGPQDALGTLKRHGLDIKHPRRGPGVDHGELATDLIGRDGHVLADLLGVADDVEVRARRFDHDDVGAFCDVPRDGAAGQTAAAGR